MGTEQEYRQKESDMKGPDQATDAGPEMIGGKTQLQTPDAQVLEEKPQIQGEKPQIQGEEPQVPEEEVRISVRGLVEFICATGISTTGIMLPLKMPCRRAAESIG